MILARLFAGTAALLSIAFAQEPIALEPQDAARVNGASVSGGTLELRGEPDAYVTYSGLALTRNTDLTVRFARTAGAGTDIPPLLMEVRRGGPGGEVIGVLDLHDTGDWTSPEARTIALLGRPGATSLTFRFRGPGWAHANVAGFTLTPRGERFARDWAIPAAPVGRCINLGGALEAPRDENWGLEVTREDLHVIADAGFEAVRLPVRWSDHAASNAPYAIEADLFEQVDAIIGWAFERDLKVVLDIHHYDALSADAAGERARFLAMWRQIAAHYRDWWDTHLLFEVINEPYDASGRGRGMTIANVDALNAAALREIRRTNPDRWVVLGTGAYGGLKGLRLASPPDDPRTVLSLHYYEPFAFTHQGAEFADAGPLGASWGRRSDKRAVRRDMDLAASIRDRWQRPLLLGEYGVVHDGNTDGRGEALIVPASQRIRWTRFVRQEAEARGFGACYWDYATSFAAYDDDRGAWLRGMRAAILGE